MYLSVHKMVGVVITVVIRKTQVFDALEDPHMKVSLKYMNNNIHRQPVSTLNAYITRF